MDSIYSEDADPCETNSAVKNTVPTILPKLSNEKFRPEIVP